MHDWIDIAMNIDRFVTIIVFKLFSATCFEFSFQMEVLLLAVKTSRHLHRTEICTLVLEHACRPLSHQFVYQGRTRLITLCTRKIREQKNIYLSA